MLTDQNEGQTEGRNFLFGFVLGDIIIIVFLFICVILSLRDDYRNWDANGISRRSTDHELFVSK